MFYLTMHSTHFIYGYMVSDNSDSERGNALPPHRLLFLISSNGSFICIIPDRIIRITAFVTPVTEHWLECKIAQWVDATTHHTMSEGSYHGATSRSCLYVGATETTDEVCPVTHNLLL